MRYPSDLTDDEWALVGPLIPPAKRGGNKRHVDERAIVDGLMYILSTGCQWRALPKDLPPLFGPWNTVFKRYRDWVKADVFKRLFDAASEEPDMEYAMVDATIVKVHRHGQGAKGGLRARPSANPRAA